MDADPLPPTAGTQGDDAAVGPLVPLLRAGDAVPDRVALATWLEALSNALGADVPHDLFALWLYPAAGGVELLGPEALAQDNLPVPVPSPHVSDDEAAAVADVVHRAGYGSAACLPVRFGAQDVGLMLVADLRPDRYGERERAMLASVAGTIAPFMARIARQWGAGAERPRSATELMAEITRAWLDPRSPRDFMRLVSAALAPLLPHDCLELLIPGPAPGQQYRLGAHGGGPPWTAAALALPRDQVDLAALFDGASGIIIADTAAEARWPATFLTDELPDGQTLRSVVGARVMSSGRVVAHLFAGSVGGGLYQSDDVRLLEELAALLAPRIEAYVLSSQLFALRRQVTALRTGPQHLARIGGMLATTARFAEATQRLAEEVRAMLPCDRLVLAVRLMDPDRVVMVEPGETRHLADLPLTPIAGTPLGQVLRGEIADALTQKREGAELIVPLRVAGRVLGAVIIGAGGFGTLLPGDVPPVQHLADLLAPHIELIRRTAILPAPVIPGWKRVP